MDCQKGRLFGSVFVLLQGLVTALFPQLSVRLTKKMIGRNFTNASDLEATPAYLHQLRAIGVGMVAASGTHLLLESIEEKDTEPSAIGNSDDLSTNDD
ncbi:hypothetical protein [Halalkalirubrum salinum]|uniref:hypothetical protein n=1 Tax=Halalkalirubrum salinum TaxID=2563889 RepID=UPI0010FBA90D|nr:hypothetical protein [Halalkalirubrum salinum]